MFLILVRTSTKLPSNLKKKKKVEWVLENIDWKIRESKKTVHILLKVCLTNMYYYTGNFLFFFYINSRNLAPHVK